MPAKQKTNEAKKRVAAFRAIVYFINVLADSLPTSLLYISILLSSFIAHGNYCYNVFLMCS